jgi:hypothetical protein
MNPQPIRRIGGYPRFYLQLWSANSAMDYEREKPRTKETTNKLANLISSLNLGSEEMPNEGYMRLAQ